jgi:hypothetical protein
MGRRWFGNLTRNERYRRRLLGEASTMWVDGTNVNAWTSQRGFIDDNAAGTPTNDDVEEGSLDTEYIHLDGSQSASSLFIDTHGDIAAFLSANQPQYLTGQVPDRQASDIAVVFDVEAVGTTGAVDIGLDMQVFHSPAPSGPSTALTTAADSTWGARVWTHADQVGVNRHTVSLPLAAGNDGFTDWSSGEFLVQIAWMYDAVSTANIRLVRLGIVVTN